MQRENAELAKPHSYRTIYCELPMVIYGYTLVGARSILIEALLEQILRYEYAIAILLSHVISY